MWRLWRQQINGGVHVCGCGHSGTSILTRIIAAHSKIHALPGETGIAKKESYAKYRIGVSRFEQEATLNDSPLWVEKTPKHIRNLRFILDCAPTTKVILISRNPRDTVGSLKRRYHNLSRSIRRWKSDNRRVLHWANHPQCISLLYENLVVDPEKTLGRVMNFLGLSFEHMQLNFHQEQVDWYASNQALTGQSAERQAGRNRLDESAYGEKIDHNSYRNIQINQPLFNNVGSYRKYLTDDEALRVLRSCGRIANALGYPIDGSADGSLDW